jgi:hypothetical protein
MMPGHTALTVIPWPPNSMDVTRVRPTTAQRFDQRQRLASGLDQVERLTRNMKGERALAAMLRAFIGLNLET